MTLSAILLLIALICFVVGALDGAIGRVNVVSLGLAFLTGALLVGAGVV